MGNITESRDNVSPTPPATSTSLANEKGDANVGVESKSGSTSRSPSEQEDSSSVDDKPMPHLHAKTFFGVGSVCLIYMTQLISLVGAGVQGQTIAAHFNGGSQVVWFSAVITIFTTVLGPIVCHAADYWGRKWFLVILTFFGGIGSLIVARATSMNMAIGGFCGIGLAFGAQPLLHAVTSETLPRRWRAHGQAADMVSNAMGSTLGLLVGGALNRTNDPASSGFRYYFYMTMAFYFAAALMTFFAYNPMETPKQKEYRGRNLDKLRNLDFGGYILLCSGLVLFCVGLSYYKSPYEFTDSKVIGTFASGLVLCICLVVYETMFKKDGLFHHGLFRSGRNFPIALFCVFAEGAGFFSANIYFAFQVGTFYEHDALLIGLRYAIVLLAAMTGAIVTGFYCAQSRRVRWYTVFAYALFVAFFIAMATTNRTTDKPTWGYAVMLGLSLGMTLTTLISAAQLSTPPELIAVASGLIISVRSIGATIAIAIYNALFTDQMSNLPNNIANAVIPKGLSPDVLPGFIGGLSTHNQTLLGSLPGITPEIIQAGSDALLDTYVIGFRRVWITAGCFVAVAGIVAVFLQDPKSEFNSKIDAPLEEDDKLYDRN